MSAGEFWATVENRQQQLEADLRARVPRLLADAPPELSEAIMYSLYAPGKRLRPLLAVLACEAVGGQAEQAYPAAAALEMIHTYSLVHDDLPAMDDDDLRRGLPTCHKKHGEALAILAGDALLTLAFECLADGYPAAQASVLVLELARGAGAAGMVGGQVLDLQADGRIASTPPADPARQLEGIHCRKTGALFRAAVRMGAASAGVENLARFAKTLDRYAHAFGLAFQVTDDLLDVVSSSDKTGKRVGKDAARGKLTYPGLLGVEGSRAQARDLGRQAVDAAESFGPAGSLLADLARFVVQRDR